VTPDAAVETFWYDWLTKYHVVPATSLSWNSSAMISNFAHGTIGMMPITDDNVEVTLKGSPVDGQFKFAPLPEGPVPGSPKGSPTRTAATIAVGDNWSMMSYTKHRDMALRFLNLVTDTQSQLMQQKLTGNLPINVAAGAAGAFVTIVIVLALSTAFAVAARRTPISFALTGRAARH
jgi:multiple sugar transport system substrate-binding protein